MFTLSFHTRSTATTQLKNATRFWFGLISITLEFVVMSIVKFVRFFLLIPALALATVAGCSSMYYKTMESVGYHKRDILVSRVESARDSQQEVKEQFSSALEEFSSLVAFEGGELEDIYKRLKSQYEVSEEKTAELNERIAEVEDVAQALFREWQGELDEYSNADLRRKSEASLRQTQRRYQQLIASMKRAQDKIAPVSASFKDQVLYLKHNLNARAIMSLQKELNYIQRDIKNLVREMERAINEADSFISEMEAER